MLSAPVYAQSDCDTGVTNTDACHTTHTELIDQLTRVIGSHNNNPGSHNGDAAHISERELSTALSNTGHATTAEVTAAANNAVSNHDIAANAHNLGDDSAHTTEAELDAVKRTADAAATDVDLVAERGRIDSEVTDRGNADTAVRGEFADADTALGGRIDGVKTTADAAATDVDLVTERGRIDSEITDRGNADTAVRGEFADADTALGGRIDGVKTTADNAATDAALDTEISARQAADGTHTTDIAAVKRTADAAATDAALDTEISARQAADGTHTTDIAAVKATADNAATQTALGTETTDRTNADNDVRGEFADADTDVRTDFATADTTERMAREREDTALGGRIDSEVTDRGNADTAVRGEFAAADLKLDGRIDDLEEEMSSGIAMSLAIQDIWIPAGKTSGLAFGSGFYNGRTAVALSGAVRTSPNLIFNGGIGVGLESGTIGGRIGTQYVW